jgi:hypothetical protein
MKTLKEALISKDKRDWATTEIDQSTLKTKDYYVFHSVDVETIEKIEKRFKNDFQIFVWPEKFNTVEDKKFNYRIRLVSKNKVNEIVKFYKANSNNSLFLYEFEDYQTIGDFLKDWAEENTYYNYVSLLKRIYM